MKCVFITGCGTDIGKTFVSAAICKHLSERNLDIAYYKAAVSGADSVESSDAGYVKRVAGLKQDSSSLLSYLYRQPLSPHLAARLEGNPAELESVKRAFFKLKNHDYVLSEGAGGAVCPLVYEKDNKLMYLDIVKALNLPVIVVADAGLGTINHTVLTVFYLKQHGVKVNGVILNNFDSNSTMHLDNKFMIDELSGSRVIAVVRNNQQRLIMSDSGRGIEEYFDER